MGVSWIELPPQGRRGRRLNSLSATRAPEHLQPPTRCSVMSITLGGTQMEAPAQWRRQITDLDLQVPVSGETCFT